MKWKDKLKELIMEFQDIYNYFCEIKNWKKDKNKKLIGEDQFRGGKYRK